MEELNLLSKKFFLFQNKYPAFYYEKRKIVFCYGKFIKLPDDSKSAIKLPKLKIESKKFNPQEPIITFITTKRCNMRCVYCSVRAGESSNDLSFKNAKLLIDKVCPFNQKIKKLHIIFYGGEPSLSIKLIEDIIKYIKNKKIVADYLIFTNGVLNTKIIDFLDLHHFYINLSFDGLPNIQNRFRPLTNGRESYSIIENSIREFVKRQIDFKVRTTVINDSVSLMLPFLKRLHNLGVKVVHFEPLNICGRALDSDLKLPDLRHYIKEYRKCIDFATKKNVNIVNMRYDNLLSPKENYCSSITDQKFVLTPNNLITRCYEVQERVRKEENCFIVGKISRNKLIINQKKVVRLKDIITKNKNHCENCFAKYICSGWCALKTLRIYNHSPDPQRDLNYWCSLSKEIIADAILRLWKNNQKICYLG